MRCWNCNAQLKEDDIFCSKCGKKQKSKKEEKKTSVQCCPECGMEIKIDTVFCPGCGAELDEGEVKVPKTEPENCEPERPYKLDKAVRKQKKESSGAAVRVTIVLVVVCILAGAGFLAWRSFSKTQERLAAGSSSGGNSASAEGKPDASDADIDAAYGKQCRFTGKLEKDADNKWVLSWTKGLNVYALDENSDEVLLENVTSAYVNDFLRYNEAARLAAKLERVTVVGTAYVEVENVYVNAVSIEDENGDEVGSTKTSQKEEEEEEEEEEEGYLIPDSDSRVLTNADIKGMSAQEINYAKNEIFARHGRKFASSELQAYFESKEWYKGTVSPENFDNSVLSIVEQQNIEFLGNAEQAKSAGGYQLDSN